MSESPERRLVRKVVGYVVRGQQLLVFTHDAVPIDVTGVQVPAGTIEDGEAPEAAIVREVLEETGLNARITGKLGVERYDVWPSKPEVHERHFFQLASLEERLPERWTAGEGHPFDGGEAQRWTCHWIPLEQAHVLCAGFGARLGKIVAKEIGELHMAEATEIPSFRPSSGWFEDLPFDVDTSVQVEACVTGSAADRGVKAFLDTLRHDPVVDGAGGARVHYRGGFTVESAPLPDGDGWQVVLASAGEDSFDSLESAAENLVDALRATPGEVRLAWRELPATHVTNVNPHDR